MSLSTLLVGALTTIMVFFLVTNSFQAILLMCSVPELWSHWQLGDDEYFHALVGSEALPPISVVATLQNAEEEAVGFANVLLNLEYPRHEVVLVDDGSTDGTLAALTEAFDLYEVPPAFAVSLKTEPVKAYYRSRTHSRLLCIEKEQGGRGDAMNAGINAARYPHTLSVGTNIVFERDALLRMSRPFLLDREVAAVGSTLRPANGAFIENGQLHPGRVRGWGLGSQTIEYLRNFRFQRLGWNRIASNLIFPSNTVLFKREHIFGVGGFRADALLPGIDLAVRLHRHLADLGINPRMPVIPDEVAWTMVPEKLRDIVRTREQWQAALWRTLRADPGLIGNPEYGAFGLIAIPYFWIMTLLAPSLELAGYVLLIVGVVVHAVDLPLAIAYLAAVLGYGILLSVWTVILQALTFQRSDRRNEVGWLLLFVVTESVGYRQIMAWYRSIAFFVDRSPSRKNG